MARPSSFGSPTKATGSGTSRSRRLPQAARSSRSKALSSDSIGTRWATGLNVTAPPLRRRVLGDELGMLGLELEEAPDEGVILGVGDLRLVELVVAPVVVPDQLPEFVDADADIEVVAFHGDDVTVGASGARPGWRSRTPARRRPGCCRCSRRRPARCGS